MISNGKEEDIEKKRAKKQKQKEDSTDSYVERNMKKRLFCERNIMVKGKVLERLVEE